MTVRQRLEQEERTRLSPYAKCAADTAGRAAPISPDDMRTDFQRDRDRIIHCKSFRRLKYKTQVFLSPVGDHYRTRLTHTLEVAQVARTLARCLQPERRPDRSHRSGPRSGAYALRAHRRKHAEQADARRLPTQRAKPAHGGAAGAGRGRAEPLSGDAGRHSMSLRAAGAFHAGGLVRAPG